MIPGLRLQATCKLNLINGIPQEQLHVADRGLQYGDGVFRTLRASSGKLIWWGDHYAKLAADARALGIACPVEEVLKPECLTVAQGQDCVVKVILTRGAGQRGYALPDPASPTRMVMSSALPDYPAAFVSQGIKVRWCSLKLGRQPRLAGIKHLNRLENVLARAEWSAPDIAEGLLLDEAGWVIGGVMSNFLFIRGKTLFTPDLSQCGVAGVTRERIMRLAQRQGMQVRITQMRPQDVFRADEVCVCNSLMGVLRVSMIDDRPCAEKGWAGKFRDGLNEDD